MPLVITPLTKIGQLLAAYPELEDELIAFAPAFVKLRNPLLRRTLGKVATLRAAAAAAGVDVTALVRTLRARLGQEPDQAVAADLPGDPGARPDWVDILEVALRLDVDQLLGQGTHPLATVKKALADLETGHMIRLTSSFKPQPMLEELATGSVRVHAESLNDGRWEISIAR